MATFGRRLRHSWYDIPNITITIDHDLVKHYVTMTMAISSFMTYHRMFCMVDQELSTLPEHLSSPRFSVEFVLLNL